MKNNYGNVYCGKCKEPVNSRQPSPWSNIGIVCPSCGAIGHGLIHEFDYTIEWVYPSTKAEELIKALSEVVGPDALNDWLLLPNERFGGDKPTEMIAADRYDELWAMVHTLRSGEPV